jgi:outer membrane protein TolC
MLSPHRSRTSPASAFARTPARLAACAALGAIAVSLLMVSGCGSGLARIDRNVDRLIAEGSGLLGPDAYPPGAMPLPRADNVSLNSPAADERPSSVNPPASALNFRALADAGNVLERLQAYNVIAGEPLRLDLNTSLQIAFRQSRDYLFAEEDYVLAALRLLAERHLWGPRFFDEVTAEVISEGDEGFYDTSLEIVNEFRVTQRLPYGGEISARALARAVNQLHTRVAEDNESAQVILDANIPLLRGAGLAAREDLIQAERDLIYASRDFEDFRRDFYVDLVSNFLDLVVQQQAVANAERQVEQLRQLEQRERALYESGRTDLFNAALAEQSTVEALDQLNDRRERYRLDVDRFKVRLQIPVEQAVIIVPSSPDLPVPQTDMDDAVRLAMAYRLDLQTQRDVVDDSRRNVAIADNRLLPDVNVFGSINSGTDVNRRGFHLEPDNSIARAGVTVGIPLDREIERVGLRQAQIGLERSQRNFEELRDTIAVDVRSAVREIDRARYSLEIQQRNIRIGEDRVESIQAAPDRATARDASEAADDLLQALDSRDSALRDLQLAILAYLQQTGQLRIKADGTLQTLPGMVLLQGRMRWPGYLRLLPSGAELLVVPHVVVIPLPPAAVEPIPGEDQLTGSEALPPDEPPDRDPNDPEDSGG